MRIFILFVIFEEVFGQWPNSPMFQSLQRGRELLFEIGRPKNFEKFYDRNLKLGVSLLEF